MSNYGSGSVTIIATSGTSVPEFPGYVVGLTLAIAAILALLVERKPRA